MARINERELAFALMCKSTNGNILVTLIKAVWGRKVSFSSQFQRTFIMAGRAQQQKLEALDHILLAVRKERAMDGYAQLALSFSFGPGCMPAHGMLLPTLKVLPTVNSIQIIPRRHAPRLAAQGILGPALVTDNQYLPSPPPSHPWVSSFPAGDCTSTACMVMKWT